LVSSFCTSFPKYEEEGTVDQELAMKLQSELELEKDMEQYPSAITEFLENAPEWQIHEKAGDEEVEMVRRFGDETIRVGFSVEDINALSEESLQDDALFDDEHPETGVPKSSAQSGGAQSKVAKEEGRVPNADEVDEDSDYDEPEPSFPARVTITIEKPNQGALTVEAIAQDGMFVIENFFYHKSAALATAQSADAEWERRGVYGGPSFTNLDEDLQVLLERYLDERGINTSLALFIPEYIEHKEQKEYVHWLENVKNFVEA